MFVGLQGMNGAYVDLFASSEDFVDFARSLVVSSWCHGGSMDLLFFLRGIFDRWHCWRRLSALCKNID